MATQSLVDKGHQVGTPGHSLALKYEVFLQEFGSGSPTIPGINSCFQVLDDLLPHLGVYQRVLKLVRDELHKGVYSSEWTSGESRFKKIAPLPYFVIAQRLLEKRTGEHSKLKAELSSLKEQLYTCEADLEKALSGQEGYRHDLKDRDSQLHKLASDLHLVTNERKELAVVLGQAQQAQDKISQEHNLHLMSLRNINADLKEKNFQLSIYKKTHDRLQEANLLELTASEPTRAALVSAKSDISQQSALSEKLFCQLHTLRNTMMDEYDAWMLCDPEGRRNNPLSPADTARKKKSFSKRIAVINSELSLLEVHQKCLTKRAEQLSEDNEKHNDIAVVLPFHPNNPLIPQQPVTSKYAAMVYGSSDGGQSFYPLKGAQFCYSCSLKTVLCPHKVCEDVILQLPSNTSHLKISRPPFQLHEVKELPSSESETDHREPAEDLQLSNSQHALHSRTPDFSYLWSKLHGNFLNFKVSVPRKLSQEQLLALLEHFYVSMFVNEEMADSSHRIIEDDEEEEEPQLSLVESLQTFLHHHYLVRNLTPFAFHAAISALHGYHLQYKEVLIVSHALCGDLDASAVWFTLLQASLVHRVQWTNKDQLPAFFHIIYPFLEEEALDQLCMSCVVHSNNRLSAAIVLNFLQVLLLRHKDPLVVLMESKLTEMPSRNVGRMLEVEFADAMENIIDGYSSSLGRRLFLQSLKLVQDKESREQNSLPLRNLAYIAAYLQMLITEGKVKEELKTLCKETAVCNPGSGMEQALAHEQPRGLSTSATMDTIRLLVTEHIQLQKHV